MWPGQGNWKAVFKEKKTLPTGTHIAVFSVACSFRFVVKFKCGSKQYYSAFSSYPRCKALCPGCTAGIWRATFKLGYSNAIAAACGHPTPFESPSVRADWSGSVAIQVSESVFRVTGQATQQVRPLIYELLSCQKVLFRSSPLLSLPNSFCIVLSANSRTLPSSCLDQKKNMHASQKGAKNLISPERMNK